MGNQNMIPAFFKDNLCDDTTNEEVRKRKTDPTKRKTPIKRRSKRLNLLGNIYPNLDVRAFKSMFENKVPVVLGFLTSESKLSIVQKPFRRIIGRNSSRSSIARKRKPTNTSFPCASHCRTCLKVSKAFARTSMCGSCNKITVRKHSPVIIKKSERF